MRLNKTHNFFFFYKKLPEKVQQQFKIRLELWLVNPEHPTLRTHLLKGNLKGHWSINITGDYRAVYYFTNDEEVVFTLIGTHSQLY